MLGPGLEESICDVFLVVLQPRESRLPVVAIGRQKASFGFDLGLEEGQRGLVGHPEAAEHMNHLAVEG